MLFAVFCLGTGIVFLPEFMARGATFFVDLEGKLVLESANDPPSLSILSKMPSGFLMFIDCLLADISLMSCFESTIFLLSFEAEFSVFRRRTALESGFVATLVERAEAVMLRLAAFDSLMKDPLKL